MITRALASALPRTALSGAHVTRALFLPQNGPIPGITRQFARRKGDSSDVDPLVSSDEKDVLAPFVRDPESSILIVPPESRDEHPGVIATGTLPLALPLKLPFPVFPPQKFQIVMEDAPSLAMLDRGLKAGKPRFGIYPLTPLEIAAGHAVVDTVGVTAHVLQHELAPSGGSTLITQLRRRFRVVEPPTISKWGYPIAKVEYFDDFEESQFHEMDCWDLAGYIRFHVEEWTRRSTEKQPADVQPMLQKWRASLLDSLPRDPKTLSFWLARQLPVPPEMHRNWLRSTSTRARLSEQLEVLKDVAKLSEIEVVKVDESEL